MGAPPPASAVWRPGSDNPGAPSSACAPVPLRWAALTPPSYTYAWLLHAQGERSAATQDERSTAAPVVLLTFRCQLACTICLHDSLWRGAVAPARLCTAGLTFAQMHLCARQCTHSRAILPAFCSNALMRLTMHLYLLLQSSSLMSIRPRSSGFSVRSDIASYLHSGPKTRRCMHRALLRWNGLLLPPQ